MFSGHQNVLKRSSIHQDAMQSGCFQITSMCSRYLEIIKMSCHEDVFRSPEYAKDVLNSSRRHVIKMFSDHQNMLKMSSIHQDVM
ncbi:hypothetical protein BgiBS90_016090 [Biomphalaria glabrata]|nr:hypothetical protein BgiBS90_016090 [Biomphalaria glabrata]